MGRSRSASPSGNPPRTTPMSAAGAGCSHEPSCSRLFVRGHVLPFSSLGESESFLPDSPAPLSLPSATGSAWEILLGSLSNRALFGGKKQSSTAAVQVCTDEIDLVWMLGLEG